MVVQLGCCEAAWMAETKGLSTADLWEILRAVDWAGETVCDSAGESDSKKVREMVDSWEMV